MSINSPDRTIYKKAPIIEAIIDLRFEPVNDFDISKLDSVFREKYLKEYPTVKKEFQNEFTLECGENPQQKSVVLHSSLRFVSEDEKHILRIRPDAFTFSRLAPYQQWEPFRDETKRLLDIYYKEIFPKKNCKSCS